MTLNDYNQFNRPLHLKSNEIGVNTSMQMLDLNDSLVLRGKSFNIKPVEETNVNSIRFSENINLIVKMTKNVTKSSNIILKIHPKLTIKSHTR